MSNRFIPDQFKHLGRQFSVDPRTTQPNQLSACVIDWDEIVVMDESAQCKMMIEHKLIVN